MSEILASCVRVGGGSMRARQGMKGGHDSVGCEESLCEVDSTSVGFPRSPSASAYTPLTLCLRIQAPHSMPKPPHSMPKSLIPTNLTADLASYGVYAEVSASVGGSAVHYRYRNRDRYADIRSDEHACPPKIPHTRAHLSSDRHPCRHPCSGSPPQPVRVVAWTRRRARVRVGQVTSPGQGQWRHSSSLVLLKPCSPQALFSS
jgi:hypothetical protein